LAAALQGWPEQGHPPRCGPLDATSYEDFIGQAVSIGGDTDTIGAIGGAVAEAMFDLPKDIKSETLARLDEYLLVAIDQFNNKFREQ